MFDFNDDFFKITLRALNLNKLQRHEQQFYARVKKKTFEMLSGLTSVNVSWILEIKSILGETKRCLLTQ